MGPRFEVKLGEGLAGQDDNFDVLLPLFEQLQLATVETCDPHLDLITFASSAYYFTVLTVQPAPPPPPPPPPEPKPESLKEEKPNASPKGAKQRKRAKNSKQSAVKPSSSTSGLPSPPGTSDSKPQTSIHTETLMEIDSELPPVQFTTSYTSVGGWIDYDKPLEKVIGTSDSKSPTPLHTETLMETDNELPPAQFTTSYTSVGGWIDYDKPLEKVIGMAYLTASQNYNDPLHVGELNIGIILLPQYRGKGYARRVVHLLSKKAFEEAKCHRLQAIVLSHVAKDRALCLFTEMQFGHEGTRRRSFYSPMELEWKDATYMAILDTEWLNRNRGNRIARSAPKSLWDELFARHQREREELLLWESNAQLKRTSSMATIKPTSPTSAAASESEYETNEIYHFSNSSAYEVKQEADDDSDAWNSLLNSPASDKGKRKASELDDPVNSSSDVEYETSSESSMDPLNRPWKLPLSPLMHNPPSSGYASSTTSWDALDSSPSPTSSFSDSEESSAFEFIYDGL